MGSASAGIDDTTHDNNNQNNNEDDLETIEGQFLSLLEESEQKLNEGYDLVNDKSVDGEIDAIRRQLDGLQRLQEQVQQQEKAIARLVAAANVKQIEGLIERLNSTFTKEMTLRRLLLQEKESKQIKTDDDDDDDRDDFVTRSEFLQVMNVGTVLSESEQKLSEWVLLLIQAELEEYKQRILAPFEQQQEQLKHHQLLQQQQQEQQGPVSVSTGSDGCASITEVVQKVHGALTKFSQDGIGLIDHAQRGEIVHSLTSATFVPPPSDQELLGTVWWRKFIPEDWETLLPSGWESWNVGLPAAFYHTLGLNGAKTSPPETILESKVVPGSCWPMAGSHGQVTIRLPYPIHVETFSLDHVSSRIIPEYGYESAPKKLKVIVYPPCPEPEECGALGFDLQDPMEVAQIEYDIDGSMVQTFDSIFVQAAKTAAVAAETNSHDLATGNEEEGSSCSAEAAACSTPPRIDVAAVTVKILENYGNPEYTCIYRFRVHGEQLI